MSLQLGLVGFGTIARAQHLSTISATFGIVLAAIASLPNLSSHPDIANRTSTALR